MPDAFSPAGLAKELAALSGRDRRAVLRALSPAERHRLGALLEAKAGEGPAPNAEAFAPFSPWLAERLREARDAAPAAGGRMTPAVRRLLLEAARAPAAAREPDREPARAGSLLDAIGGLFEPRRWSR